MHTANPDFIPMPEPVPGDGIIPQCRQRPLLHRDNKTFVTDKLEGEMPRPDARSVEHQSGISRPADDERKAVQGNRRRELPGNPGNHLIERRT